MITDSGSQAAPGREFEGFARALLAARHVDGATGAFGEFLNKLVPDSYCSLWYQVADSTSYFLLSEFGNRNPRALNRRHTRVLGETGVVGRVQKDRLVRLSSSDTEKLAIDGELLIREEIGPSTSFVWTTNDPIAGAVFLGHRRDDSPPDQLVSLIVDAAKMAIGRVWRLVAIQSDEVIRKAVIKSGQASNEASLWNAAVAGLAENFDASGVRATVASEAGGAWDVFDLEVGSETIGRRLPDLTDAIRNVFPSNVYNTAEDSIGGVSREVLDHICPTGPHDEGAHLAFVPVANAAGEAFAIVAVSRPLDELPFLPPEVELLERFSEGIAALVALLRREATRRKLLQETQVVASEADFELAVLNCFLAAERIVPFETASLLMRDPRPSDSGEDRWHERIYSSRSTAPGNAPLQVAEDDHAVVALAQPPESFSGEVGQGLRQSRHLRAIAGEDVPTVFMPLVVNDANVGQFSMSGTALSDELPEEELAYVSLLVHQLSLLWNVDRLQGADEGFFRLVDGFSRLLSSSLLSLALAHETRGKLGALSNYFDVVASSSKSLRGLALPPQAEPMLGLLEKSAESGDTIVSAIANLAEAISDTLLASDDAHGSAQNRWTARQRDQKDWVYVNETVALYLRGLRAQAAQDERKISLKTELAQALDRPKYGESHPFGYRKVDQIRLGQLLSNLVLNAMDASHSGAVEIRTRLEDGKLYLEVQDYGVGISDEAKARLFEPFFSRRSGSGRQGFGLGMTIVKLLVDEMAGSIEVDTAVGAGTTFTVIVPIPVVA